MNLNSQLIYDEFPVIDVQILKELKSSVEDELFGLIDLLLDEVPKQVAQLQDTSIDHEELLNISHSLKSSTAYFGLVRLSQACQSMENSIRNGQVHNLDVLVEAINMELAPSLHALKDTVKKFHLEDE